MSFLNANTPDEMRAAVAASIDPLDNLQIEYDRRAQLEAKAFAARTDSKWMHGLIEDEPFIADAMHSATSGEGFDTEPEPGRAILVFANSFAMAYRGVRLWTYISDVADSFIHAGDQVPCHRCELMNGITGSATEDRPIAGVFHLARGRYVVEFALCLDCIHVYESQAVLTRIWSGDTYIELEDPRED
ncbi:hypothetical protein [Leifsonia xyli]|uniref:hypothetical protein n=1 Tax=Leifsonia xyli TaxID=1575 RepID=UPI003D66B9C0